MSFSYLEQMPIILFRKDPDSYYDYVNNHVKQVGLVNNLQDIIGKTDADLPWGSDAEIYRTQDLLTLRGVTQFNLDIVPKQNGDLFLNLCHKSPVFSENGKIVGVGGVGFELHYDNYTNIFNHLIFAGMNFSDFIKPAPNQKRFVYKDISFTRRQAEVISFLLKGYSAELTATELKLSRRTIELYLSNIKDKLQCNTKQALVKKAFKYGFINLIFMKFN